MTECLERRRRKCQKVIQKSIEERRLFMKELKKFREESHKELGKKIQSNVGPCWYQVLTVRQRAALDSLQFALYQDVIEGRPVRASKIVRNLCLHPFPHKIDIMNAMDISRDDPKIFLARLFFFMYDHPICQKRAHYDLNMRILCSSLFYLGLPEIKQSLEEMFKPDESSSNGEPKPAKKLALRTPVASPYLEKLVATPLWQPAPPKRKPPPPLPNLKFLNDDCDDDDIKSLMIKSALKPQTSPPQPAPPSPPRYKTRMSRYECDKFADIFQIHPPPKPATKVKPNTIKTPHQTPVRKKHMGRTGGSKLNLRQDEKKVYGICVKKEKKKKTSATPPIDLGHENQQYLITGVYTHKDRLYYMIGGICILPPSGWMIHGGHVLMKNGKYIEVNSGMRAHNEKKDEECECLEKWESTVTSYVQNNKCRAGHSYDFRNEGTFPSDEVPYFIKPTPHAPSQFQYDIIYEMNPNLLHIQKEVKRIWENESLLAINDDDARLRRDKKSLKKKVVKNESKSCLGDNPSPDDYLRCALRFLKKNNVAATLPDLFLAPELKEWMRYRVHGALSSAEKKMLIYTSILYWRQFKSIYHKSFANLSLLHNPTYTSVTTWRKKTQLNQKFKSLIYDYQVNMYKAYADANNLLWGILFHPQLPDRSIRNIFFTYLIGQIGDVCLARPYCYEEMLEFLGKRAPLNAAPK